MTTETGNAVIDKNQLYQKLDKFGQTHLLRFWDSLSEEKQQHFAEQIQSLDFESLQSLFESQDAEDHWHVLAAKAVAQAQSLP